MDLVAPGFPPLPRVSSRAERGICFFFVPPRLRFSSGGHDGTCPACHACPDRRSRPCRDPVGEHLGDSVVSRAVSATPPVSSRAERGICFIFVPPPLRFSSGGHDGTCPAVKFSPTHTAMCVVCIPNGFTGPSRPTLSYIRATNVGLRSRSSDSDPVGRNLSSHNSPSLGGRSFSSDVSRALSSRL